MAESLIKSCLFNWLGYGNLNSPIWFIGTEEGGAEVWREKTKSLESSLQIRSEFDVSMDFYQVWENLYKVDLKNFKGITVWHFIACFLLSWQGKKRTSDNVRNFIFHDKKLGRLESEHFLCELFPLPKKSKDSIEDYVHIWPTVKKYQTMVLPGRFDLITRNLLENKEVKLLVSYERTINNLFLENYRNHKKIDDWAFMKQKYSLYKILLNENRVIFLLATPFFGQGQISYEGLALAASKAKDIITEN